MNFPKSCLLVIGCALIAAPTVHADILWYNGDYDNRDAATDQTNVPINIGGSYLLEKTLVYDDFIVPVGQTWTLSSVYADVQLAFYANPTKATWEIRSGMSAGNGGTVVASGDTTATLTTLTPVSGYYYADPETRVTAAVANVTLTAGTYWLAVAPDSLGYYGDQAYIETTSGTNAAGVIRGTDGNSFINNNLPTGNGNLSFAPASSLLSGEGNIDFSMGVNGTIGVSAVPEPASLILIGLGILGTAPLLRRRGATPR